MSFRWTDHFYCPSLKLFFNYNVLVHKQPIVGPNFTFPCLTDRGKKQFYRANSHNFYSDNLHQTARTQTLQIHFSHDLSAIFTVPLTSQERRVIITAFKEKQHNLRLQWVEKPAPNSCFANGRGRHFPKFYGLDHRVSQIWRVDIYLLLSRGLTR